MLCADGWNSRSAAAAASAAVAAAAHRPTCFLFRLQLTPICPSGVYRCRYAKQGLLCGTDGLPHLIADPGLALRYGHAGDVFVSRTAAYHSISHAAACAVLLPGRPRDGTPVAGVVGPT